MKSYRFRIKYLLKGVNVAKFDDMPKIPQRTTPSFAFSNLERAIKECCARRKFGKKEAEDVYEFFQKDGEMRCVYCGSNEVSRWDHLVSINDGGETVVGNMVPACQKCDDSKRNMNYEEWMKSAVPGSPKSRNVFDIDKRIEKIQQYMDEYHYVPKNFIEKLSNEGQEEFKKLKRDIEHLDNKVKEFIEKYKFE